MGGAGGAGGSAGSSGGAAGTSGGSGGSGGSGEGGFGGVAGSSTGTTLPDGGTDPNLIADPGFESGIGNWVPLGNPTLSWHETGPYAGTHCLKTTNRMEAYDGPSYSLAGALTASATYHVSFWIRTANPDLQPLMLSQKITCLPVGEATTYSQIINPFGARNYWSFVEGDFVAPACELQEFFMYFEGPIGEDIYVDEVRVVEVVP